MTVESRTVKNGETALIVCTKLTGTREIATDEKTWPMMLNNASGTTLRTTDRVSDTSTRGPRRSTAHHSTVAGRARQGRASGTRVNGR